MIRCPAYVFLRKPSSSDEAASWPARSVNGMVNGNCAILYAHHVAPSSAATPASMHGCAAVTCRACVIPVSKHSRTTQATTAPALALTIGPPEWPGRTLPTICNHSPCSSSHVLASRHSVAMTRELPSCAG